MTDAFEPTDTQDTGTPKKRSRFPSILTGLRALLMFVAGLYAVFMPEVALLVVVIMAGAIFLIDGVLGLWAITFGGAKTGNFWFDVARNVLSIITGAVMLISPLVATIVTAAFLVYLVAFQAIFVGIMEIYVIIKERELYARIWPVLLSGLLYVLFGALLIFWPLWGAIAMVMMGGVLMMIFAVGLFALAFRLYKAGF